VNIYAPQTAADFEHAHNRAFFRKVIALLLGQKEQVKLLSFDDVKRKIKWSDESYIGLRSVPVNAIVGSVGRYKDFDREFLPVQRNTKQRWRSIDEAYYLDVTLPPVQLYKVGDVYFVKDGNHRVSVARERETGTFDQLLVTPMRPIDILLGKGLPGLLIGVVEASAIIAAAVFWFDVPLRGGLAPLYLGLVLFVIAVTGIGLAISSLAATQQQALLGAFLFMVPSIILSGFATPIANMPPWVQDLTLINPMRYFLVIVRSVFLEGAGVNTLASQYWPMAAIGLASLAAAGWLFRKRVT